MQNYVTGEVIRGLREKRRLTQRDLAQRLNVSDKTISKWETGRGLPDITLLEPLAGALGVSVTELLSGGAGRVGNRAAFRGLRGEPQPGREPVAQPFLRLPGVRQRDLVGGRRRVFLLRRVPAAAGGGGAGRGARHPRREDRNGMVCHA